MAGTIRVLSFGIYIHAKYVALLLLFTLHVHVATKNTGTTDHVNLSLTSVGEVLSVNEDTSLTCSPFVEGG